MRGDRLCRPIARLGSVAPAADEKSRHAAFLRRQLQAAALREVERSDFADDGAEARDTQGLLQRPERVVVAARAQIKEAVRVAEIGGEGTGIEVALPRNPQGMAGTRALRPAQQPHRHCRGEAGLLEIECGTRHLMERPQAKTAARQMPVNGIDAPIEYGCRLHFWRQAALQQGNAPAQGSKARCMLPQQAGIGSGGIGSGGRKGDWLVHYSLFVLFQYKVKEREQRVIIMKRQA